MGLVFLAQRTACAKAQSTVNPGNFWWEKGGGFALVGKKQRVQGAPVSPSGRALLRGSGIGGGPRSYVWHGRVSLAADTGR